MRIIDADAFIDYLNKSLDDAVDSSATPEGALLAAAIKEAFVMDLKNEKVTPTIDAVEVVQCKDCVWHDKEHQSTVFYNSFFCKLWQIFSKPDHFCKNGIRRRTDE